MDGCTKMFFITKKSYKLVIGDRHDQNDVYFVIKGHIILFEY